MSHAISERTERALLSLFPVAKGRPDAAAWLVDELVDAELYRRGTPDKVSGAAHALALTQGSLLKEEYDLSTHGHAEGWTLGAVLADPREFTVFNMHHGLPAGDAALRAIAGALRSVCPKGRVVRLHTDGFAALLGPTAEQAVEPALVARANDALRAALAGVVPGWGSGFTLGLLELTVVDPPNWQVLGPLAWAECERALLIARRQPWEGVLRRTVRLDGRLPELPR